MGRIIQVKDESHSPSKIGLVFAGGGGKGAYQVGVWKAIQEYELDQRITAVSGTSVGALNGVLFASSSVDRARDVWLNISPDKILSIDLSSWHRKFHNNFFNIPQSTVELFAGRGVFSRKGLTEIIQQSVHLSLINTHSMPVYATAYDAKTRQAHYFLLNRLSDEEKLKALLASAALPFVFDPVNIHNQTYWDGGLVDNTPITPLYDMGCSTILVVHLNRMAIIDKSKYPDAKIIEIFPKDSLGAFFDGTLDFSPANAQIRMEQGYRDAKCILEPIYRMMQTQVKLLKKVSEFVQEEEGTFYELKKVLSDREELKKTLRGVLNETE